MINEQIIKKKNLQICFMYSSDALKALYLIFIPTQ